MSNVKKSDSCAGASAMTVSIICEHPIAMISVTGYEGIWLRCAGEKTRREARVNRGSFPNTLQILEVAV